MSTTPRKRVDRRQYVSALFGGSSFDEDEHRWWRERELRLIENALEDMGELEKKELGDLLGQKYWGPRRFAQALKEGAEEGRFRKVGRNRYASAR